jgi:hypothetical protein
MFFEYSIEDIKNIYDEDYDGGSEQEGDVRNTKKDYENILFMEKIVSENIDRYNINSSIYHIFPITISLSAMVLLAGYIILY